MKSNPRAILYLADNCMFSSLEVDYLDVLSFHRNNGNLDITDATSKYYRGDSDLLNDILKSKGINFIPFEQVEFEDYDYIVAYYGVSRLEICIQDELRLRDLVINSLKDPDSIKDGRYKSFTVNRLDCLSKNAYAELSDCGINESKIIPCTLLCNPDFSIDKFIKLRKNPPTILANNCFGRYTYFSLGIPFYSPFVNITLNAREHIKLLENPRHFIENGRLVFAGMRDLKTRDLNSGQGLSQPLQNSENESQTKLIPTAYLETDTDRVLIYCNHYSTFEDFEKVWNRRKKRINYDNIIGVLTTESSEYLERFSRLSYPKLCFLRDDQIGNLVIDAPEFEQGIVRVNYSMFVKFNQKFYGPLGRGIPDNDFMTVSNNVGMRSFPFYKLLEFVTSGKLVFTDNIHQDLSLSSYLAKMVWG